MNTTKAQALISEYSVSIPDDALRLWAAEAVIELRKLSATCGTTSEMWDVLLQAVDTGDAEVTIFNRLDTINTGLTVNSAGDLFDEVAELVAASRNS